MPVTWDGPDPEFHLRELAEIVGRTLVEGLAAFRHRGTVHPVPPASGSAPFEALVTSLAWHLYQHEYCLGRASRPTHPRRWASRASDGPRERGPGGAEAGGRSPDAAHRHHEDPAPGRPRDHDPAATPGRPRDEDLTPALVRALGERVRWELGWRVERVFPGGGVTAVRDDERRGFLPGSFEVVPAGSPPVPGVALRIRRPPPAGPPRNGFLYVDGSTLPDPDEGAELVRFYWNVEPRGAPRLVAVLVEALDRLQVPFRFKVAHRSAGFDRADPAILYVHRRFFQAVASVASNTLEALRGLLRPGTPLFTLPLAPGLALAEDPFSRRSFGVDRCRGIARGLAAAWHEGAPDEAARLETVSRVLNERGVDPSRPYLNPGARDVYVLPFDWRSR